MSTVRETVRVLRGRGRGWTLLLVAGGWLFINGFRVLLPALLPQIKADFLITNASAGFALTVLWLLYAGVQFPAGVVADRIGVRTLLIAGVVAAALSMGAFYLSPVFAVFLLVCGLFGFGAGLFGTPRDMLLSRTFPDVDNTAYSVTFAAGSLGAAGLPYIATVIADRAGWRFAVLWLFPLLLVVAVGLARVVPASHPADAERLSALRTAREALGALTDRTVLLASVVMVLYVFTYQAVLSFLPTYLVEIKGLDQGVAATLFGLIFVVSVVLQPLAGHLADQYREKLIVLSLIVLSTVTLLALVLVDGVVALVLVTPLVGVRTAVGPPVTAFIVRDLPTRIQGTGWGLLRTLFFGLGATGSSVIGLFADAGLFDAGFLLLTGLTGLAAVVWLAIPHHPIDS